MKYSLLTILLILGFGCATNTGTKKLNPSNDTVATVSTQVDESKVYVSFIQNVHDWVFPEKSINTLKRLIDLHEQYKVPVEMYLDDQVVQAYLELEPTIFDRLKSSEYVTISYHIRPPHPVYEGFDTIGLADMNVEEQYNVLYQYETHRLDMKTGEYTNEPGGYAFLKELIGYAPRVVTHTNSRDYGSALSRVYKELGAVFGVVHGRQSTIDQTIHGLHLRPEQVEVKLYEDSYAKGFNAEKRFAQWTKDFDGAGDFFINLKWHENNFYTKRTPFGLVYWNVVERGGSNPKSPPFDLTAGDDTQFRTTAEQAEEWQIYEETLSYVAEQQGELTAITSADLEKMLDK